MELPTYTGIWRIEKRLYKLYDFRLPMPLPVGQIAVFAAVTIPYVLLLTLFGLPFNHTLFWLYVIPPGALTWLATRPVLESKRLPELLASQLRYLAEPATWCRLAPLAEPAEVVVTGRIWRRQPASAAVSAAAAKTRAAAPAEQAAAHRRGRPATAVPATAVPATRASAVLAPAIPAPAVPAPAAAAPGAAAPGVAARAAPVAAAATARGTVAPVPRETAGRGPLTASRVPVAPGIPEHEARRVPAAWGDLAAAPRSAPRPARPVQAWPGPPPEVPAAPAHAPRPAPAPDPDTGAAVAPAPAAAGAPVASTAPAAGVSLAPASPAAGAPVASPAPAPMAPAPPVVPRVVVVPARPHDAGHRPAPPAGPPPLEHALGQPSARRGPGWRSHVSVTPGGRGPGRPDPEALAAERAAAPLAGPGVVVVLGCTVGAGQTVTTLMTADVLASVRGEPVAAVDLNPGPASLASLTNGSITASAYLAAHAAGRPAHAAGGRRDRGWRGGKGRGQLDVISDDGGPGNGGPLATDAGLRCRRLLAALAASYGLSLVDPGAAAVARVLPSASQLLLVVPASPDAARSVGMTCEWLAAHGHGALADRAVAVINGVSQRSAAHAEQAERAVRGRCRAIVRVPWDDHLAEPLAERGLRASLSPPAGRPPRPDEPRLVELRPPVRRAYTALAGVLVSALAESRPPGVAAR